LRLYSVFFSNSIHDRVAASTKKSTASLSREGIFGKAQWRTKVQEDEKFAVWIAGATLRSGNREVDAITLDTLAQQATKAGDLKRELDAMRQFDRRGGDFGAEIVGAVLIPILIEAGKQLWAAYLKKLTDQAAAGLANLTADVVKAAIKRQWSSPTHNARAEYETIIRREAGKQGLSQAQTDALVAAVHQPEMAHEVASS
jgi:hypothetical protein